MTGSGTIVARVAIGLGLVVPLQLHWLTRGNGSTFTGIRLASTLLHNDAVGTWGRIGGVGVFVVAFLGAAAIATAAVARHAIDVVYLVAGLTLVVVAAFLAVTGHPRFSRWGPGFVVTTLAALSALALGGGSLVSRRVGEGS